MCLPPCLLPSPPRLPAARHADSLTEPPHATPLAWSPGHLRTRRRSTRLPCTRPRSPHSTSRSSTSRRSAVTCSTYTSRARPATPAPVCGADALASQGALKGNAGLPAQDTSGGGALFGLAGGPPHEAQRLPSGSSPAPRAPPRPPAPGTRRWSRTAPALPGGCSAHPRR